MKIWMVAALLLMIVGVLPCTINTVVYLTVCKRAKRQKIDPKERSQGDERLFARWSTALDCLENTPHERVTVRAFDGVRLSADWYPGKKEAVLLFHGYHSSPVRNCGLQAADLIADGWSVLLPWQRAHGDSKGLFSGMGYLEARDILSWHDWVRKEKAVSSSAILGVSMGGCAVGQCAADLPPDVKAIVIDCAYDSFAEQFIAKAARYTLPFRCDPKAVAATAEKFQHIDITRKASDRLAECHIPALFVYGDEDAEVSPDAIKTMHKKHGGEKELFVSRGAGHARGYESGGKNAEELLLSFLGAHLHNGGEKQYGGQICNTCR